MARTQKPQNKPPKPTEHTLLDLKAVVMMRAIDIDPEFEQLDALAHAGQIRKEAGNFREKIDALHDGADDPLLIERSLTRLFERLIMLSARLELNLNEVLPLIWDDESNRSKHNVDFTPPKDKENGED